MVFDSSVGVEHVRRALNGMPAEALSDDAILQAIDRAEVIVDGEASDGVDEATKRVAVVDLAAYRAVTSSPASFTEQKQALDLQAEVSVEDWIGSLREDMNDSLARVSNVEASTLYTLGDRRQRNHQRTGGW